MHEVFRILSLFSVYYSTPPFVATAEEACGSKRRRLDKEAGIYGDGANA
jgi:hypothetical protein